GYPISLAFDDITTKLTVRKEPAKPLVELVDPETAKLLEKRGSPDVNLAVLSLQGPLLPGHSGAPILDGDGRVIAVGNGGLRGGTVDHGWAVPLLGADWTEYNNSIRPTVEKLAKVERELFISDKDPARTQQMIEKLLKLLVPPGIANLLGNVEP